MNGVKLNQEAINNLFKPISGTGGHQSLLKKLQGQYDKESQTLEYDNDDLEKIKRYSEEYGKGSFQDRFNSILSCIGK